MIKILCRMVGKEMRRARAVLRGFALAAAFASTVAQALPFELTVMTRNLYFGADLGPVLAAPSVPALIAEVTAAYGDVLASNPAARMTRIAEEISVAKPDIVGLQEAVLWRTRTPSVLTGSPGSEVVAFDFIQMLLDKLGPTYALAVKTTGFNASAPGRLSGVLSDIRLTDREAILVRTDRPADQFKVLGTGSGTFGAFISAPIAGGAGGTVNALRTFAFVDVTVSGVPIRLTTTHLEPDVAPIQVLQGNELIAALGGVPFAQIVLGDFNSKADGSGTATYGNMLAAGFKDAWLDKGVGDGFTAAQAENLLNFPSALDRRIDFVFHNGGVETISIDVIGEDPADRIVPPGLWPSDHAGVLATLRVIPEPNTMVLLVAALGLLMMVRGRRR